MDTALNLHKRCTELHYGESVGPSYVQNSLGGPLPLLCCEADLQRMRTCLGRHSDERQCVAVYDTELKFENVRS
jgi:hypothetical protein